MDYNNTIESSNTLHIQIEKNSAIQKLYNTLKYRYEMKDFKVSNLLEYGNPIYRVTFLIENIGNLHNTTLLDKGYKYPDKTVVSYLLAEKYYGSVEEVLTNNVLEDSLGKIYLPSMYERIKVLVFKYGARTMSHIELKQELKILNDLTLKILFKIV